ncbi:MAG TPA: Ig-like domain-containing protein [Actinomycetota bacterium]|nr:Ig-like domain-containing protein [Actinomycetota bacterium]
MKKLLLRATVLGASVLVLASSVVPAGAASPADAPDRSVEPVILTGAQLPGWSGPAAEGVAEPYPSGSNQPVVGQRDAHNGRLVVPPAVGVDPDAVVAYAYDGERFEEIPVQVDERFPYFLSNPNSDFAFYSGTDKELTYAWDTESWKKTAGRCEAEYPEQDTSKLKGFPTTDPVPTLDHDDEVVFMADDAGLRADLDAQGPPGTGDQRHEIALVDPRDPTAERYVYLFTKASGPTFTADNGYVDYERDANADEWIDKNSFTKDDPEKLGTSNEPYGPNLSGTVCDPDGTVRNSTDRFPRDGVTVTTDTYQWRATGRWMIREMHVTAPGTTRTFGPDLIDRWKGRAFQQSPESNISLVGFEDEQVNWEANSALLGELEGPVRAIREVWGADSGTNVTKTETFYRDLITYRYRVRVHPIPPDGLYTSWDYNHDKVATYFNETKTGGVPIDGVNDDILNIDEAPNGDPAFFDAPDPTFTKPLAFLNWEQVAGRGDNGSLVYMFELKNAQGLENPTVVPYYRDDACFDDGTGDNPSPRLNPGDPDPRDLPCYTEAPAGYEGPYQQGAFGSHGVHYFFTGDTDNATAPVQTTEIDGQQWQWAVPTDAPKNVGDRYANTVKTPLVPVVTLQPNTPGAVQPTALKITGATSGQTTDEVVLEATLTSDGQPVAGETISFTLDGAEAGEAVTAADGSASVPVTLSGPARTTEVSAVFGGSESYRESSATAPFEVLHEDSSLELSLTRSSGNSSAAGVRLAETDDGSPLAGRTVTFLVNGAAAGSATTGADGSASVTLRTKKGDVVTASFAGDEAYAGATDEETVTK